jgi:hypothetical protein
MRPRGRNGKMCGPVLPAGPRTADDQGRRTFSGAEIVVDADARDEARENDAAMCAAELALFDLHPEEFITAELPRGEALQAYARSVKQEEMLLNLNKAWEKRNQTRESSHDPTDCELAEYLEQQNKNWENRVGEFAPRLPPEKIAVLEAAQKDSVTGKARPCPQCGLPAELLEWYEYSTPFKVKQIATTLDEYVRLR